MKKLKKGFTLIELLVVIAIIGILATTLAPKLREQLAKAKDAKAISLLGAARTAAGTLVVDKMVQDTTSSSSITLVELKGRLDSKAVDLLKDGNNIEIGGSREDATKKVVYGGNVALVTSGTAISSGADISIDSDEVNLTLDPTKATGTQAKTYNTEGKEWIKY